jgi:hypothetical protein
MVSAVKRKLSGRVLTIISKLEELQQLGCIDSDVNSLLPSGLEGWMQELVSIHIQVTGE